MGEDVFPLELPIVVITGEYESGKTLAILTTGYPLKRTLIYDNEESATLYESLGPFRRVDIAGQLPQNWTNLQFYEKWLEHARAIKPGEYDVIGIDPIERLESGLTDWVERNPTRFGHSVNQYRAMSGLKWGDVKDLWGQHILELKAKCKMVILTAHMRSVWVNDKPTDKRERKGKDTLSELATLELELVRKPGMIAPAARVLKHRLVYGDLSKPSTIRPMFDPWIKEFTWDKVRWYMEHGADPDNLVKPPEPSQEEKEMHKLELQAEIARAKVAEIEAGVTEEDSQKGACPVCKATASASSDKGHAPWCKMREDGSRYDNRKEKAT
jgi:hypothetical protein